jgi:hypothetical protein
VPIYVDGLSKATINVHSMHICMYVCMYVCRCLLSKDEVDVVIQLNRNLCIRGTIDRFIDLSFKQFRKTILRDHRELASTQRLRV